MSRPPVRPRAAPKKNPDPPRQLPPIESVTTWVDEEGKTWRKKVFAPQITIDDLKSAQIRPEAIAHRATTGILYGTTGRFI